MAILSVDLAFGRWTDLGIVVMERGREPESPVVCEIVRWSDPGPVAAEILAGRLNHLCGVRNIRILMLDGPQAWKSVDNGLDHARLSERQLNTMAKTGLPGMVKPVTFRPFVESCMDVYDALSRRGWRRLETSDQPHTGQERLLVESYPCAAWKALKLRPLKGKRGAKLSDLAESYMALQAVMPFTVNTPPRHDELQAIVGGLPGLALETPGSAGARIVGSPPRREHGHWREGFIVLPQLPGPESRLRWLN